MSGIIGTIADDYTGGTDVAVAFRRAGLRTVMFFGLPPAETGLPPHDSIVIALKSRMIPAEEAVEQSLSALRWLQQHGLRQTYFKYCSTFDSTPAGNIGPVLDALADELGVKTVMTTPSSPEHLRTQYGGQLFVDDVPLADSHMRHHPLTPMTDSDLTRLLGAQTRHTVSLVPHATVRAGDAAILKAVEEAERRGDRFLVVDAIDNEDLRMIGRAASDAPLVAGAAGLAGGLAAAAVRAGGVDPALAAEEDWSGYTRTAVLAGSCSARTLEQIEAMRDAGHPTYRLDALAETDPEKLTAAALDWYVTLPAEPAPLIYSSLPPQELERVQAELGVERSASILETSTSRIAVGLVERGVDRLIAAGGETSGAIVSALNVTGGLIGREEARGVPWIHTTSGARLALLLKSGNFGDADLLTRAASMRAGTTAAQA